LFRSRAYQKNATELVVMITPQILRRDSVGVTPNLPSLVEPFLAPPPRVLPVPPPPFTTPRSDAEPTAPSDDRKEQARLDAQLDEALIPPISKGPVRRQGRR
jgi:hypothetical protein